VGLVPAGGRVETEQTVTQDVVGDGSTPVGSATCLLLRQYGLNLTGLARLSRLSRLYCSVPAGGSHCRSTYTHHTPTLRT
jgi:hypothetical protein